MRGVFGAVLSEGRVVLQRRRRSDDTKDQPATPGRAPVAHLRTVLHTVPNTTLLGQLEGWIAEVVSTDGVSHRCIRAWTFDRVLSVSPAS